jgi:tetratricopeptide (TPR) repeat protein
VGSLGWFWFLRGRLAEGRGWIDAALALAGPDADTGQRAKALHWKAGLAFGQGDFGAALAPIAESLALFRAVGDHREVAYSLLMHGLVLLAQGDPAGAREQIAASIATFREQATDRWGEAFALYCLGDSQMASADVRAARASYEESLGLFQELEDRWGRAVVLHALGEVASVESDHAAARSLFAASEELFRGLGDRWDLARVLLAQADAASHEGDYAQAERLCTESLALSRDLGNRHGILRGLGVLARALAAAGDAERATRLLAVISASLAPGTSVPTLGSYGDPAVLEELRTRLGEEAFTRAWTMGRAVPLDDVVAAVAREGKDV